MLCQSINHPDRCILQEGQRERGIGVDLDVGIHIQRYNADDFRSDVESLHALVDVVKSRESSFLLGLGLDREGQQGNEQDDEQFGFHAPNRHITLNPVQND